MSFFADNLLAILVVFWLVVVISALIFVVLVALKLWRGVKRTKSRLEEPMVALSASAQEAQDRVTVLQARQTDIANSTEEMKAQVAGAAAAGKHAGDVVKTLRFPVRFLAGL